MSKKNKVEFYYVNCEYINYLHSIDKTVHYSKGGDRNRPYLMVKIPNKNPNYDYYIPISSRVDKKIPNELKELVPILKDVKNKDNKLALLLINNTIPVPKRLTENIEINKIRRKRTRALFEGEYKSIKVNQDQIFSIAKAFILNNEIYKEKLKNVGRENWLSDIRKLEKACIDYMQEKNMEMKSPILKLVRANKSKNKNNNRGRN